MKQPIAVHHFLSLKVFAQTKYPIMKIHFGFGVNGTVYFLMKTVNVLYKHLKKSCVYMVYMSGETGPPNHAE